MGEQYLGQRYVASPLGEGAGYDRDPLIRYDAFDCVTFVETVLADGDVDKLTQIRYKNGVVDFVNRNHFIETDWLNNNSDLVENISGNYGKTQMRHVVINRARWLGVVHGVVSDVPVVETDVEYIPYENLGELSLENPMIVLFVVGKSEISDKIGTDLAVVHMGLVLPNGVLRHASSSRGAVVDVDFDEYVNSRRANNNNIGIALVKIK